LLAAFVMVAMVTALAASVLGLHAHVLPDGRMVVHWHPVDKGVRGKTNHQHSGHEYTVLANLGHLTPGNPSTVVTASPLVTSCVHRLEVADHNAGSQTACCSPNKRSPPATSPL